jgi:DNA-binding SARP family transcriptional activator/tetratricopeptide (TPR) repeat protein
MAVDRRADEEHPPRVQFIGVPMLHTARGVAPPLTANDAAMLALPCLDRALTRTRLVELLWPDVPLHKGLQNLRQRRFRIRQLVGAEPLAPAPGDRLELQLPHDLGAPEIEWRKDALALPGELLGTFVYAGSDALDSLVHQARERWRVRRAAALRECALAHESAWSLDAALSYRTRLCDDDPLDEAAHADLIRLHYLRAEPSAVQHVYDRLCRALAQALQQTPSASTTELYERLRRAASLGRHPARSVLLLRPSRIVGRDGAWQSLQTAHARGATAVVQGEPGMGKSRLLQDFLQGCPGAVAAALRPADAATPYAMLARVARAAAERGTPRVDPRTLGEPARGVLATIVPEWGEPARETPSGPALLEALAEWLRVAGAQVVAVDDCQSADPESMAVLFEWLDQPAASSEPRPWWLLAVRRAEVPGPLRHWIDTVDTETLQTVDLQPLDVAQTEELLDLLDLQGLDTRVWAELLHRHCGGNPLFLLETVRALHDNGEWGSPARNALPLPARVGELLQRRITQLDAGAAKLAAVAAIAGDDLDAELAAAVLGAHLLDLAPAWTDLEHAQVLRGRAFTHDLLRDAARQSVPAEVGAAMHARIAAHLAQRGEQGLPERAAHHWEAAGRLREAAAAYTLAAQQSARRRQRDEEGRRWQHAIRALEAAGAGDGELVDLKARTIENTLLTKGPQAALALTDELLLRADTARRRLAVLIGRLKTLMLAGRFPDAASLAPEVLDLAEQVGDQQASVVTQVFFAQAQGQGGLVEQGLQRLAACAVTVCTLADPTLTYEHLMAQAYLLRLGGRHRETVPVLDRALPLAESAEDAQELITVLSNRALSLYDLGRAEASHADASRAQALHARLGDVTSVAAAVCATHVGVAAASLGRHSEAIAHYESARANFAAAGGGMWLRMAEMAQATLYVQLGQFARAAALLAGDWQAAAPQHRLRRHLLQARLARWQGQPAQGHVEAARRSCAEVRPALRAASNALVLIEASYSMPLGQACALLADAVEDLSLCEEAAVALLARSRLAECLLGVDPPAAHRQARRCHDHAAECRVHDSMSTFWQSCVRVFEACGDADSAQAVLGAAVGWLRDVALPNTPAAFRTVFLTCNPAVRELASRGGVGVLPA